MTETKSNELEIIRFQSQEELLETIRPDVAIKELVAKYGKLKTNGVEDNEAYNTVVEAHKEVKKYKSAIEKKRKELKEPVLAYGKLIDSTAKSLTEDIEFLVDHLGAERKKVEDEKERLKREAEEAEARRIQGRKDALFEAGCVFNGEKFAIEDEGITELELVGMEDDEFEAFIKRATKIRKKIEADKAAELEAQKKKDEELEELKAKLAAHEEREAKEREAQEAEATKENPAGLDDEMPVGNPAKITSEVSGNDKVAQIAKTCHEVNRAYCEAIGDKSQVPWDEADDWQRESAVKGVIYHLENPNSKPEDSHNSWLAEKERTGWKFGSTKDPVKKEHPCFVPYNELPKEQQMKDHLFIAVVRSFI